MLPILLASLFFPATGPQLLQAKVLAVKDGDTVVLAIDVYRLGNDDSMVWTTSLRINGINAPEVHSKNEREKAKGMAAKEYLEKMVLGQTVAVAINEREKFGRVLGSIYVNGESLAKRLVSAGHAKVWIGIGPRPGWD